MTTLEGILAGSNSGSVVEPGKPEESLLYTLAAHLDTPKMPPNAPKISQRELNAVSAWIESLSQSDVVPLLPLQTSSMMSAAESHNPSSEKVASARSTSSASVSVEGLVKIEPVSGPLAITALAGSGSLLAVSGFHQVLLYDLAKDQWLGALNFPEGDIFAIQFVLDGSKLVAGGGIGGAAGHVVSWDMKSYRRLESIEIADDAVLAMDISPDGRLVAVSGPKRVIEIIELATGKRHHVLRKHADWVTKLAFSGDGVFLASGDRFGSVYIWNVHDGVQFDTAIGHTGAVTGLQFSADSNQLWSSGKDGCLHQWDLQQNSRIHQQFVSDKGVVSFVAQPDRVIVVDNERRVLAFESKQPGRQLCILPQSPTVCAHVQSPTESLLVGDTHSGLHWVGSASNAESHSITLPSASREFTLSRFAPKRVERELQVIAPPEGSQTSVDRNQPERLKLALEALATSRKALEKAKGELAEAEAKLDELQVLVEQLEPK